MPPLSQRRLDIYRETVARLAQGLRADRAAIVYLADGRMSVASVHNLPDFDLDDPPISETVLEEVMWGDRTIVFSDVKGDYQARGNVSLQLSGAVSLLCVPYYNTAGVPVGALYADTTKRPGAFHRNELNFARDCASWLELSNCKHSFSH